MSDCDDQMSASEKKKEDWMNAKWRPMMGWMYMAVCACDFMVFPVLWSIHQALDKGQVNLQWQPLTLQGAGLFHIAMGAVLGIAAYGRTKEKMAGAENGGLSQGFGQGAGTQYTPPGMQSGMMNNGMNNGMNSGMGGGFGGQQSGGFGAPAGGGFGGQQSGGFGTSSSGASAFGAPAAGGFGGSTAGGFGAPASGGFGSAATPPTFNTTPPVTASGKPSGPTQTFPAL